MAITAPWERECQQVTAPSDLALRARLAAALPGAGPGVFTLHPWKATMGRNKKCMRKEQEKHRKMVVQWYFNVLWYFNGI